MADQQHRALVIEEQLFQQFQGFHVEIVGRFIQNEQIGRAGEQFGQQQAIFFPTGQDPDRRPRPLRGKEKILQVTINMAWLAIDDDLIVIVGEVLLDAAIAIKLLTQLIKIGDFQVGSQAQGTGRRL